LCPDRRETVVVDETLAQVLEANRAAAASHAGPLPLPRHGGWRWSRAATRGSTRSKTLGLELGDTHVIGVAGARTGEDVLASLAVSAKVGTREVLLIGHTDCAGFGSDAEAAAAARAEAGRLREAFPERRVHPCSSMSAPAGWRRCRDGRRPRHVPARRPGGGRDRRVVRRRRRVRPSGDEGDGRGRRPPRGRRRHRRRGPGRLPEPRARAGLIGLTRDLAQQWTGRRGIRVNAIAPGFFASEMTDKYAPEYVEAVGSRILAGRWGDESELAATVVFLAGSGAGYTPGRPCPWTAASRSREPPGRRRLGTMR
jgi:Enoyl-(Acyl carrier protein) reductase